MFFRNLKWDIIAQRNIWFALSGLIIVAGIVALVLHGGLKLGLSFTGGTTIDVKFDRTVTEPQIRQALSAIAIDPRPGMDEKLKSALQDPGIHAALLAIKQNEYSLQLATKPGDKNVNDRVIISTQAALADQGPVLAALDAAGLHVDRGESQTTAVGPSLSREYLDRSLIALVIALALQLIYIAFRFGNQLRYGIIADLALIHDVLVMVGIYAIANRPADDAFLAALLTVIGYSVMDSIVIFDRIRENTRLMPDVPYAKMVNISLLQTMTRSVNTLATVLITLFALYFFGGDTLKNFAFALIVGVTSGAYSSIFIASPLLVLWKEFEERKRSAERRAAGAAEGAGGATARSMPMRRLAQKPKRTGAPPPRYRRKRSASGAPLDEAPVGVMSEPKTEEEAIGADERDADDDTQAH